MPSGVFADGFLGHEGSTYWVSIWLFWYRRWLTQDINFLILILTSLLQKWAKIINVLSFLHQWLVTEVLSGYAGWSGNTLKQLVEMFTLVGVHSTKTTMLSWSRQLGLSEESRRIQGHHRASSSGQSVQLYARDDVFPAFESQKTVCKQILMGFRPICPLRRGSGHLLLMLRFQFLLYRMIRRALKCPIVSSVNTRKWSVSGALSHMYHWRWRIIQPMRYVNLICNIRRYSTLGLIFIASRSFIRWGRGRIHIRVCGYCTNNSWCLKWCSIVRMHVVLLQWPQTELYSSYPKFL